MLKSSFFFIWNGACTLRFRQTPICCRVRIVKHSQLSETVSKIYVLEHRERMPVSSANERALPSSLHLYFMAMRPETDRLYSQFYWANGHQTWRSLKSPHSVSCLDWKKKSHLHKNNCLWVWTLKSSTNQLNTIAAAVKAKLTVK